MRVQVNLNLSHISVPELIENGRHYTASIAANVATFATPNPALPGVNTALTNVETAYTNALGGGRALTAIMHEKKAIAINLLVQLGHYVEAIANGSESVALLAGMSVKRRSGRGASVFTAKMGTLPMEVNLQAPFMDRHSYIWQMVKEPIPDPALAVDPAHSWTQIGVSNKGSFVVSGLTAGDKYWFRYATVGKDGQSGWSDPVSIIVTE